MGMAASQARLLTITARMHDIEYKSQSIQNAKVQLATQSDQVYQDYLEALDATTLTVKDYDGNTITANFNNLCGRNAVDSAETYALKDSNGRLIVEDDIYDSYHDFLDEGGDDPYLFAMWMMGDGNLGYAEDMESIFSEAESKVASGTTNLNDKDEELDKILQNAADATGYDKASYLNDYDSLVTLANGETDDSKKKILQEYLEKYESARNSYRYNNYKQNAQDIYTTAGGDEIDFDQDDFEYYVRIFKEIQTAGDCVPISDYDGPEGDAANNSDWLQNMIQCGKITVDTLDKDTYTKTGEVKFSSTSPSSDSSLSYTTTTTIDKTALAKAEAQYEHDTKEIDQKDKKYDMDLSKLETERTALTTEYDSVKKVISDNIERTFGIFS